MKHKALPLVLASLLALGVFSGCAGNNAGGATTCHDYIQMSDGGQSNVVAKMLRDRGEVATTGVIKLTQVSVLTYCSFLSSSDAPIDGIYGP